MLKNCVIKAVLVDPMGYHNQEAERGTPEFVMSPSSLKEFAHCPSRWKNGYKQPDSDAKDFGNLLDTIFLTPTLFQHRYALKPETYTDSKTGEIKKWNGNSNTCKAWLEDHADKAVVTAYEVQEAQLAAKRLAADETIEEFVKVSDKQVHLIGQWDDPDTGVIVPVQCLMDLVPKGDSTFQKSLGDLKTTRNASQGAFAKQVFTFGWHIQAALDIDLFVAATKQDRTDWIFIAVENYPPYAIGRRLLSQDFLDIGRATYRDSLKRYARCLKTGVWDGYDAPEEFSLVQPQPWMTYEILSQQMETDQINELAGNDIIP